MFSFLIDSGLVCFGASVLLAVRNHLDKESNYNWPAILVAMAAILITVGLIGSTEPKPTVSVEKHHTLAANIPLIEEARP